jgi:hypothetical protein
LVLLFVIVWRGDARFEAELAGAPDGERVDGLLAGEVLVLGVHDAALVQPDVALVGAVDQAEDTGLPADADELNDVGKVKLGEGALEGHGSGSWRGQVSPVIAAN